MRTHFFFGIGVVAAISIGTAAPRASVSMVVSPRAHLSARIAGSLLAGAAQAAALSTKEQGYLRRHATTLCGQTCAQGIDWSALGSRIRGKRIVALGEFNHGAREIAELRNDLIRALHQKGRVGALLFESGIGELAAIDDQMDSLAPAQLTNGFFGGWRTTQMQALMAYAQQARIPVAGFDVQRTGQSFRLLLAAEAEAVGLDGTALGELEQRFDGVQQRLSDRKAGHEALVGETSDLIEAYRVARDRLAAAGGEASTRRRVVLRTLDNRATYLTYMLQFTKDKDWRRRWAARDSAMADNVIWLAENVYPGKTLVLIAHNYHAAKGNETESVMGEILYARYGRDFYSIGMFGGSGSYANNSGVTVAIAPPDTSALDLKQVIGALRDSVALVLVPRRSTSRAAWLDHPIVVNDSFIDLEDRNTMRLATHFDALVLLARVSPPTPVHASARLRGLGPTASGP